VTTQQLSYGQFRDSFSFLFPLSFLFKGGFGFFFPLLQTSFCFFLSDRRLFKEDHLSFFPVGGRIWDFFSVRNSGFLQPSLKSKASSEYFALFRKG